MQFKPSSWYVCCRGEQLLEACRYVTHTYLRYISGEDVYLPVSIGAGDVMPGIVFWDVTAVVGIWP